MGASMVGKGKAAGPTLSKKGVDAAAPKPEAKFSDIPVDNLTDISSFVKDKTQRALGTVSKKAMAGVRQNYTFENQKDRPPAVHWPGRYRRFPSFMAFMRSYGVQGEYVEPSSKWIEFVGRTVAQAKNILPKALLPKQPLKIDTTLTVAPLHVAILKGEEKAFLRFCRAHEGKLPVRFKSLSFRSYTSEVVEILKIDNLKLEHLDLSGCKLNADDMESAVSTPVVKRLVSLDLNHSKIGDVGAWHLRKLENLTSLNVASNYLGPKGAKRLRRLTKLVSLNISSNEVRDKGARHLRRLKNLKTLNVGGNKIGDRGAGYLSVLTTLIFLDVYGNNIGSAGAGYLSKLKNLTQLNVGHNSLIADDFLGLRIALAGTRIWY